MTPAILLTRPKEGADQFAKALAERFGDIHVVQAPVLRIEGTGAAVDLSGDPALVFTSRHAVAAFAGAYPAQGRLCYCVGAATGQAARAQGMRAVSADGNAADLADVIRQKAPQRPLLHLRGDHVASDLAGELRASGLSVQEVIVYRQVPVLLNDAALALLDRENPVIVPLFSPRSAAQLVTQHRGRAPLWVAAISARVAEVAQGLPVATLCVADHPDAQAMLEAVAGLIDAGNALEGGRPAQ